MDHKPGDLFIDIESFFGLLLPGALFSLLLWEAFPGKHVDSILFHLGTAEKWAALFIAAYVVGHFLSTISAPVQGRVAWAFKKLDGYKPFHGWVFTYVDPTAKLEETVKAICADSKERLYDWAEVRIYAQKSPLTSELTQLHADLKFFRNLVPVCVLALIALAFHWNRVGEVYAPWIVFLALMLALVLSLGRIGQLLFKMRYRTLLALLALREFEERQAKGSGNPASVPPTG